MRHESLVNEDWTNVVARLGGAATLNITARETKAFLRPREIASAVDLLRLILAYCLGERGLRSTAAWATSVGLVDISSVALLYRLRQCGDWFALLVGQVLAAAPPASEPRPDDPHRRRHHGAEERTSGPEEEQVVAHSQCLRSSTGTLWPLRTDRSAGGRDARPDTGGCRRDPPCRSCLFATGPWPP
jgi:hypothetical protein